MRLHVDRAWLSCVIPGPQAEQLLRAALTQGEGALHAWGLWNTETGLDRLDEASFRLLPLVYRNLLRQEFRIPELNTLKGIYRQAWLKNQILLSRTAEVLRLLHAEGVPTIVMKGAALSALHYRDGGLRPMRDVDVLVPRSEAQRGLDVLERSGWRRLTWAPSRVSDGYLRHRHAISFAREANEEFDLHWHPFFRTRDRESDEALWAAMVPLEVHGEKTSALDPAGQLLQVCLHGMEWNEVAPIRWVADAMTILRAPEAIRWEFLTGFARRTRTELFVSAALDYLAGTFDAPIPDGVLRDLTAEAPSPSDVAEFRRAVQTQESQSALDTWRAVYRQHWRGSRELGPMARLAHFPEFLQNYWRLESPWGLVSRTAYWMWRRSAAAPARLGVRAS